MEKTMPKKTSLYQKHTEAQANIIDFHGWLLPVNYPAGILNEAKQTRTTAGIFDLSHMGEIEIKGQDSLAFLQKIVTNDVSCMEKGEVQYNMACNPEGGIIDDFMTYRKEDSFLCVVNASNIKNVYHWFDKNRGNLSLEIEDKSDDFSLIALQGPLSEKILKEAGFKTVQDLVYMHFIEGKADGISCLLSRTGYTGDDGFEIYVENKHACELWDLFLERGKKHDLHLCGLGARDILRLEMGYPLYGNDITSETNPIEASLGWAVKPEAKDFIGKEKILEVLKEGIKRKRTGFIMKDRGFPRTGYEIYSGESQLTGNVTSGAFSPNLEKFIGACYVKKEHSVPRTKIFVKIRDKLYEAEVVNFPFLKPRTKKEA